jgi:tetratricopeptide (TPR) repeat protein
MPSARRDMTARRFASSAEADRHDLEYWRQMSDAERVLQVWRLSLEQWQLRGGAPHEPGLCRSVARVRRSASLELGRNHEAEYCYKKALEVGLNDAYVHARYGMFLRTTGRLTSAKQYLRRALKLDPGIRQAKAALSELGEDPESGS